MSSDEMQTSLQKFFGIQFDRAEQGFTMPRMKRKHSKLVSSQTVRVTAEDAKWLAEWNAVTSYSPSDILRGAMRMVAIVTSQMNHTEFNALMSTLTADPETPSTQLNDLAAMLTPLRASVRQVVDSILERRGEAGVVHPGVAKLDEFARRRRRGRKSPDPEEPKAR